MFTVIADVLSKATFGDWLMLSVALLILLYIWGTWNYDYFQKLGIHHIKPRIPFLGNATSALLGLSPFHDMVEHLYKRGKDHGVLGVFEFRTPILLVRDPELLKMVTVKDFDHFTNHRVFDGLALEPLFLKNLFNLKDAHWRGMRATISPAFTSSKMKGMFPLISQCAEQMVSNLLERYAESKEGRKKIPMELDIKDVFTRMANDVIASAAFGIQCDSLKDPENDFYNMGKKLTQLSGFRMFVVMLAQIFPKIMVKFGARMFNPVAVEFFDGLVQETVRERQEKGIFRPDMLQLLMQAREGKLKAEDEDDDDDQEKKDSWKSKLGDDDITGQLIVFFFAGFETISTTLFFIAYALSFHSEQQKRLQQEIDEVYKATEGKPKYEAVQGMKYLDAVINETMRLFTPNPNTDRQCNEDTVLPATETTEAIRIPKGMVINIPFIGIHHDPEFWTDPMTFNPDRFLEENKNNIKPYTFMPFGIGPRICIAQRFALLEIKIAIFHLLRVFDLHPSAKVKYPVQYKKGLVLSPVGGFLTCLKPRRT